MVSNNTRKKYRGGNQHETNDEKPTVVSNAKKIVSLGIQGVDTIVDLGIDTVAKSIGENSNQSIDQSLSTIFNKLEVLKTVIKSPEGQKILVDISIIVADLARDVLVPAIDETVDVLIAKSGKISKQIITTALDVVGVVPVVGEVVEAVRAISDIILATEHVIATGVKITGISAVAIGKVDDKKQQMQGLLARLTNMVITGVDTVNAGISTVVDGASNSLTNTSMRSDNVPPNATLKGGGLKNLRSIQRGGIQSAKRAYMAQFEFLNPHIRWQTKYKTRKYKRRN